MKHTLWIALLTLTACASIHPGNESTSSSNSDPLGLKISARLVDEKKEDSFSLIEVTLENENDDWVKIASAEVPITNPAESKLSVVVGKDLFDWADAVAERDKLEKHNRAVLETVALAGGATALVFGGGNHGSNAAFIAGTAVYTGALGFYLTDIFKYSKNQVESAGTLPDHHLYTPFSIPGRLFTRKWVVLNRPVGKRIELLAISLKTVDGRSAHYTVQF